MPGRTKILVTSTYGILLLLLLLRPNLEVASAPADDPAERLAEETRFFEEVRHMILNRYVDEQDSKTLLFHAIQGMLDPLEHARLYRPDEADRFQEEISGAYTGIGLFCAKRDNGLFVESVIPGAPAGDRIAPGDEILQVQGVLAAELSLNHAYRLMRGEPGSTCTLKIRAPGTGRTVQVELARKQILRPSVTGAMIPGPGGGTADKQATASRNATVHSKGTAYILLHRFFKQTAREFAEILASFEAKSLSSLIVDLRGNTGGVLDSAVAIANLFVPEGVLVRTRGRDPASELIYEAARTRFAYPDLELVVLIDQETASAAEVLAGILQDYDRATLVGGRSFGKGVIQSATRLEFMDEPVVVKFPIARYHLPSGRTIAPSSRAQGSGEQGGLEPDHMVKPSKKERQLIKKTLKAFNLAFTDDKKNEILESMRTLDPQFKAALDKLQDPH